MNKKVLLITAGSVVILVALGYFLLVPYFQVNAYANTIGEKQTKTNEALNKVRAVLDRDSFVKSDVEHTTVVNDVKIGNEAVTNAESELQNAKSSLTTFNSLPLLGAINGRYKAAESLKSDEKDYIAKSEAFLGEMKNVLSYQDKLSDASTKFADFATAASEAMVAETPEEYSAKVNKGIETIQPVIDALANITPPSSLKDSHEYNVKALRDVMVLYKQSATAMTSGNDKLLEDTFDQITTKGDEITKKNDEYTTAFIRSSELQKSYAALFDINQQITKKQSDL